MKNIIVRDRQTLFDIAIQYCGDREVAFQIADINNLSLTATLSVGLSLEIPTANNQRVVSYYASNSISPATAAAEQEDTAEGMTSNDEQYFLITNNDSLTLIPNNHV